MFNKAVLWDMSYGVYVVSALDNLRPVGCVANSAMQITHNVIALSLNHENYTNSIVKKTGVFALSILSESSNPDIISTFGFSSGRDSDKFIKTKYKLIDNLPVILDSVGYLTLKTINTVELDTHTVFIAEITGGDIFSEKVPMTYKYYHDVIKGRAPKAAPTYVEPEITEKVSSSGQKFRCKICGYIYEGDISKEPPNYVCPVCKKPKSFFEPVAYA